MDEMSTKEHDSIIEDRQNDEDAVEIMIIEYVDDEEFEITDSEHVKTRDASQDVVTGDESLMRHNIGAGVSSFGDMNGTHNDERPVDNYQHTLDSEERRDNISGQEEEMVKCEYLEEEYLSDNCDLYNNEVEGSDRTVSDNVICSKDELNGTHNNKTKNIDNLLMHNCKECDQAFISETFLKYHRYKHKHDLPFLCNVCNEKFDDLSEIISHEDEHMSGKPYQCLDCKQMFQLPEELLNHREIHVAHSSCSICKKNNESGNEMKRHVTSHNSKKQRMFKCKKCTATFFTEFGLRKHSKMHKFQCIKCGLISPNARYHKKHLGTHKHVTSFTCYICKDVFTAPLDLSIHMKEHQDFEFQCMDCFKTFKQANDLEKHRKIHSNNAYIPILPKPSSNNDFKMVWKT